MLVIRLSLLVLLSLVIVSGEQPVPTLTSFPIGALSLFSPAIQEVAETLNLF